MSLLDSFGNKNRLCSVAVLFLQNLAVLHPGNAHLGSARNSARSGSQRGIFTGSHRRVVRRRRHTEPNPPGRSSSRGSERRRMQSSTNANRTSSEERTPLRTGTNKSSSTGLKHFPIYLKYVKTVLDESF